MLRTSQLFTALSLCLLASVALAQAQSQSQPQPKPSQAPPKLDVIEQGADAPITVAPPRTGGTKITEKKEGGRVTEVKVKSGKSSYTMKSNTPAGNAQPGDAPGSTLRAPQWTVFEFDFGNKKKNTDKEAVPDAATVPPPPPMPAAAK